MKRFHDRRPETQAVTTIPRAVTASGAAVRASGPVFAGIQARSAVPELAGNPDARETTAPALAGVAVRATGTESAFDFTTGEAASAPAHVFAATPARPGGSSRIDGRPAGGSARLRGASLRSLRRLFAALLPLYALLLPAAAAAKAPDTDDIIDRTMDASSPWYYTGLMMRYNAGDETLDDTDYHYLYYGYAHQEEYKPLETNPDLDKVLLLAAGLDPDKPAVETLEAIVAAGEAALRRDPFSPKVLNLMAFAYGALGDKTQERAYFNRMNGVLRAINQSGDGLTQKSPRHILMFDHALDVLTADGLSYGKSRVISRTVEFVPLTVPYSVGGKKRKGFYFDFSRVYWNKPEGYTYQRDRTWQFNNLKPRTYK